MTKFMTNAIASEIATLFVALENAELDYRTSAKAKATKLEAVAKYIADHMEGLKGDDVDKFIAELRGKCVATSKGKEVKASANLWNRAVKLAFEFPNAPAMSEERKKQAATKESAAKAKADLAAKKRLGLVDKDGKPTAQDAKTVTLPPALAAVVEKALADSQLMDNLIRAATAYEKGSKSCGLSYKKAA